MKLVNSPFLGEKIRMVRQSKTRVANETVVDDIFRLFETRKSKITYNSLKRHFLKSCRPWQARDLFGRFLRVCGRKSHLSSLLYIHSSKVA